MPATASGRHALTWVGAVLATLLAGCGLLDGGERPTLAPEPPATTTTTQPTATELLDAGAEPRRPLRLRLARGAATALRVRVDLDVSQRTDAGEQDLDMPPVVQTVELRVDQVQGREAQISSTVTDVTVDAEGSGLDDAEVMVLVAELRALVGLTGEGRMTDRGELLALDYTIPDGMDPTVADVLEQMEDQLTGLAVPLPEQPVGLGGQWRATSTTDVAGMVVSQLATYRVTGLDGAQVSYTVDLSQTAGEQPLDQPALPDGTTATLRSSQITGRGEGTLPFDALVASASTTMSGSQELDVRSGDRDAVRLRQDVSITVAVAPAT